MTDPVDIELLTARRDAAQSKLDALLERNDELRRTIAETEAKIADAQPRGVEPHPPAG